MRPSAGKAWDGETVDLIGIDHPLESDLLNRWRTLSPESIGAAVSDSREKPCSLSIWLVREHVRESEQRPHLVPLAVDGTGQRVPLIEKRHTALFLRPPARSVLSMEERRYLIKSVIEPMLQRELQHRGIASETGGYSVELVGWVEVS